MLKSENKHQDVILLVDDNPDNLQVLYQTLQSLDCKILIAKNGKDALELINRSHPAIILLDIMMPGMNGFEVIKQIKQNSETAKSAVIFLSALDDVNYKIEGFNLGAVDYISKPFQTQEVIARVNSHLKIIQLEKQLKLSNQQLEEDNTQILMLMGEGLIKLDGSEKVTYANQAALSMSAWSAEKLIGSDFHQAMQHSDVNGNRLPKDNSQIIRHFHEHSSYTSDKEYFWRYQGEPYPVEYSITSFQQEDKLFALIVFKDISLRKNNEKQLNQALTTVEKLKEKLEAENSYLQQEIKQVQNFCGIVGESSALQNVLREVEQVAATDSTVLISGESGTGKEAIARAIHELSLRKDRPLIKVNCAAIPESLVESELFGHVKGAFTSAVSNRTGHFELADRGTIFLDEIGELSLEIQVKLLRVLQEKEIQLVGSENIKKVDVRFIAATNRDLKEMVDNETFRMDLYYRLNVFPIKIPSLRERRSDIPLLVATFLQVMSRKLNKKFTDVSQQSLEKLKAYHWPGNIRELQNVIERSAILAKHETLEIDDKLIAEADVNEMETESASTDFNIVTLADNERHYIIRVLDKLNWVIGGKEGAADVLDLPASTLRSRMKKLGIHKN